MNTEQRAHILSELVLRYQELVLVYQKRERDYAMYSHRIAKIFRRLAEKASPEDAAFAGRCISPAVDISMANYTESQSDANAKIDEIGLLLDQLQNETPEESMMNRFMAGLRERLTPFWRY